MGPGCPSSRAPAFDCSALLFSSSHEPSKPGGTGRLSSDTSGFKTILGGHGPKPGSQGSPQFSAVLLHTRSPAVVDYFPSLNSLCTFVFRLFLLPDVAYPPPLFLPYTILNLQGSLRHLPQAASEVTASLSVSHRILFIFSTMC